MTASIDQFFERAAVRLRQNDLRGATRCVEEALTLSTSPLQRIDLWYRAGHYFKEVGESERCMEALTNAFDTARNTHPLGHPTRTQTVLALAAVLLIQQQERGSVLDELDQLFALDDSQLDADAARSLQLLAGFVASRDEYEMACDLCVRARTVFTQNKECRWDLCSCLADMASHLAHSDRHDEAGECLRRAADVADELDLSQRPQFLDVYLDRARFLFSRGEVEPAAAVLHRALEVLRSRPAGDLSRRLVVGAMATVLSAAHQDEEVLTLLVEQAESVIKDGNASADARADAVANLAALLTQFGDYETAASLYLSAIDIHESELDPDSVSLAHLLVGAAFAHAGVANTDERPNCTIRELLLRALSIFSRHLGENSLEAALVFHHLGMDHLDQEEWEDAIRMLAASLEKRVTLLGPDSPEAIITLEAMIIAYRGAGQDQVAVDLENHLSQLSKQLDT